ncbi:hypothetical protein EPUL_004253 [Erysiphe pulchra]|uniref:UBC core domain-containing protein n=1 Tax=Erysiphe pulchra TaxID=225359 RepID=A0A2S4PM06_9PEZI|nr:hypothetical protein EPUL_004253 [Erysiphe pulchra]
MDKVPSSDNQASSPFLSAKIRSSRAMGESQSTTKRLQTELMQLMTSSAPGISAFPSADGNLLSWTATIEGPNETPYSGLNLKLDFAFPSNYPASPLNAEAAELWDKDPNTFKKKVLERHCEIDDE